MTKDSQGQESKQKNYSVVIIGGGPAGVATALTLNALGVSNCLVEASQSPSRKFGEALPPNAKPLLKQLGILHLMEDPRHLEYYGNKSCWGSDQLEQKEFISEIHGHGYLLDRLHFENQLWDCYQHNNGILFAGSKLKKLDVLNHQVLSTIDNGSQIINLCSQYIVDATGRKASVSRHFGIHKIKLDTQFALSFTIDLSTPIERQITIEATRNGWWYAAPAIDTTEDPSRLIVMFFTLKELLPQKDQTIAFLKSELMTSLHLSKIISPTALSNIDVKIIPAGTSRLPSSYGQHWIAVGDAAFAYDPISSYGITSALASGYYAAQAIASSLTGKREAMDAYRYVVENAFGAYMEKLGAQYAREGRWHEGIYWKGRRFR